MSGAPRSIGHALKEKLLPRSRKLPQQNPSSTSQPSLQSPTAVSNGEPTLLSRSGIATTLPHNASSATATLPLWQSVRSIAKDQLSKKEREQLDLLTAGSDSIESAISAAKDAHKAAKDRRWVYRRKQESDIVVMERIGRILRGMENYAKIGDILIQSSPEITALVWGVARFILQVFLNRFDIIESLEAAMETIIEKMAECEFYASIYAESLQVTLSTHQATLSFKESSDSALPEFYAAVVVFSVKAKAYFASTAVGAFCFVHHDMYLGSFT